MHCGTAMYPNLGYVLGQALGKERAYDWADAVKLYEKFSSSLEKSTEYPKLAEICARIGYCLFRAAFQAQTSREFKTKLKMAFEAYIRAVDLYKKIEMWTDADQCMATALYIQSRLAKSSERKTFLHKCCELQRHVVMAYEQSGDQVRYGRACNELLTSLIDAIDLEPDWKERKRIVEEAIGHAERAITVLSKTQDINELTRVYALTSMFCYYAEDCCESGEQKKATIQKGLDYGQKAVELSDKIKDEYIAGFSDYVMAWVAYTLEGNLESASTFAEKATAHVEVSRDKFLAGLVYLVLAQVRSWILQKEESPEKKKQGHNKVIQFAEESLKCGRLVSEDRFVGNACYLLTESYYYLSREVETSPKERHSLLEKGLKSGRVGLKYAERSRVPRTTLSTLHALSKALYSYSISETQAAERQQLLEQALQYRERCIHILEQTFPFTYWEHGAIRNYYALITAELAKTETDRERKTELLERAVSNMESCLEFCKKAIGLFEQKRFLALMGRYQDWFGEILNQLFLHTGKPDSAQKAIAAYEGCTETFGKAEMPCHVAESHWRIAGITANLGKHLESAKNFEIASETYKKAVEIVPQLKTFYTDLSVYMQAWSEIEKARYYHETEEHANSAKHYELAAKLHGSLRLWSYLEQNYWAWAKLESAEDLSRRDKGEAAIAAFKRAIELFVKAKNSLDVALPRIEVSDERDVALKLSKASDLRQQYCWGRIYLEEARIAEKSGNHQLSAEKYGFSAKTFEAVESGLDSELERRELRPIISLCQAWQRMRLAEETVSPKLYSVASELFEKTLEQCSKEETRLLALGNSSLCKALEAGTRFEATLDMSSYSMAKQYMEKAANYYLKAGFESDAAWVNATEALFDAYVYVGNAETEIDHERKARLFKLAESYLERSRGLYEKTGYLRKRDYVGKVLEKVRGKRKFVFSLSKVLKVPQITTSTKLISAPSPVHENAAGLGRLESANVQAQFLAPDEVNVGEEFNIRLDLVNVAKRFALLVSIGSLAPRGFKVIKPPPEYVLEDGFLHAKGRRLDSLRVESIKVSVQAKEVGVFDLRPSVVYVDEFGKFRTFKPEPLHVKVNPPVAFKFERKSTQRVFEYLVNAFVEDYERRRVYVESSGWKSLMQIVKEAGVSKRSIYGAGGRVGPIISELEKQGLVETRIFIGERGRGGRILKTRIAYEKETIKQYVDQHVLKIERKSISSRKFTYLKSV